LFLQEKHSCAGHSKVVQFIFRMILRVVKMPTILITTFKEL
jgi:hypothetical protein